jgi:hypothetical protein
VGAAAKFVASGNFVSAPQQLDPRLANFSNAAEQSSDPGFWNAVSQAFQNAFNSAPSAIVQSDGYPKWYAAAADSIVAAVLVSSVPSAVRSLLVRTARALWLIGRLASEDQVTQTTFQTALLVLPDGIFPLPVTSADLQSASDEQVKANAAAREARRQRLVALASELDSYRQAADEVLTTFQLVPTSVAPSPTPAPTLAAQPAVPARFVLPDSIRASLSASTQTTLQKAGLNLAQIEVPRALNSLDRLAAAVAKELFTTTSSSTTLVRIGSKLIPNDAFVGGYTVVVDPGPLDARSPGPCPPVIVATPPDDTALVPTGHGDARILGIADLLVVEQDLLRYQLGEISYIQNVLRSELHARRFKTTDTIEQTQTTETEITTEKEQDLTSAERFELQTESQTVINENASKDAGITIHASYGPSVDVTANYNTSSSTSTQQSNSTATDYAREVTNKAVQRVQTRTLTRRTVTTINVIEEVNEHSFDNKSGTADIVGVYRYVDKVYRAQIVNYGKRLMLEFIVPEPAAFLRYALTSKPIDTVSQVKPDPPGYCLADGVTFAPLQATDIDRDHYLYWASKYGAADVTSPPLDTTIATASKKGPDSFATVPSSGDRKISSDLLDVTIPDGYLCQAARVNIYGETQSGLHKVVYQLQEQQGEYVEPPDDQIVWTLQPTPTLTVSINTIGFHNWEVVVTALCTLTNEKFQDWQLKTFGSIMNAYNDLKSSYDQAIQEAKLQASDTTVNGSDPLSNAIIQQTELRKGCIALLTAQRFDLFNAVVRNVAPYGYPEIDFARAKAQGEYVAFFEQSFEWNNMVYLFYPYFWGKKDDWVTVAQLTDTDPLFGQFLKAGAARVQVPVRLGFENAILTYLSTAEIWAGEGTIVTSGGGNPDPFTLSIVDELKSQEGNNNVEGTGTLNVTNNSATVTGNGTAFTTDDESKRIIIADTTYVIKSVQSAQSITLTAPYTGASDQGIGYAIGGKLVGQPWEVKLPTNLVKLDGSLVIS